MATFNGTNGNDSFYGGNIFTGVDDIAKGLAGNDTLFGGNGKDKLYGGSDNDHLNGGNLGGAENFFETHDGQLGWQK